MESGEERSDEDLLGSWKNQYGSILKIKNITGNLISGCFESAVDKSFLNGNVVGLCQKDLIVFSIAGEGDDQKVASWTGVIRDRRMETLWHMAANEKLTAESEDAPAEKKFLSSSEAFSTGADTFEKI